MTAKLTYEFDSRENGRSIWICPSHHSHINLRTICGGAMKWWSEDRFETFIYEKHIFFSHTNLYFFLTSSLLNIEYNLVYILVRSLQESIIPIYSLERESVLCGRFPLWQTYGFEEVMKWWQIPIFHIWEQFLHLEYIFISHTNLYFFLTSSLLNAEYNLVYILVRSLQ